MNPQYFSLRLRTRCREPSRPRTAFGALERLLIPATRDLRATPALPRMAQASRCVDQKPLSVLTCAYRGEERILELRREVFFDGAPRAFFGVYPIAAIAEAVPFLHQLGSEGVVYRFVGSEEGPVGEEGGNSGYEVG